MSKGLILAGESKLKEIYSPPIASQRVWYSSSGSMTMISDTSISDLKASSLTKYDLPAPDLAKTTMLAFSWLNLSKIIKEPLCSLIPYIIPELWERVDDIKGKVVAKEVVSMLRVIYK